MVSVTSHERRRVGTVILIITHIGIITTGAESQNDIADIFILVARFIVTRRQTSASMPRSRNARRHRHSGDELLADARMRARLGID